MDRRSRFPRWSRPGLALAALTLMAAACSQQIVGPGPLASVGPQLAVERFLQASNARDLGAMARTFGTASGPVADTGNTFGCFFKKIGSWFGGEPCVRRQEVEIRMAAIADILRHEDYRIVGEQQVAGRDHPTMQVSVDITREGRVVRGVPFVVVSAGDGQWYVQEVNLERVMVGD